MVHLGSKEGQNFDSDEILRISLEIPGEKEIWSKKEESEVSLHVNAADAGQFRS